MCCSISSGEYWEKQVCTFFAHLFLRGEKVENKRMGWGGAVQEWEDSVNIHHSAQGWLVMPECEERWTVTFHRGDTSWYEERGALAAGQKAAEVETSTEPLLFGAGCAHKYEMLFRHTAVLFTVILHHQREEAFVSAWHQHICLETLTLLGRHHRFRLQRDSLHQIPSAC